MSEEREAGTVGRLDLDQLLKLLSTGEVDTVMCAAPDPYGRLVGKRLTPHAFRTLVVDGEASTRARSSSPSISR
jgi:glutamine synthetase